DCAMPDHETDRDRLANRRRDLPPQLARHQSPTRPLPLKASPLLAPIPSSSCLVQKQEFFSCFANGNQGYVVVLRCRDGKVAHVVDNFLSIGLSASVIVPQTDCILVMDPEPVS